MTRGDKVLINNLGENYENVYEKDTDVNLIKDKKIAIFGYGAKDMLMH